MASSPTTDGLTESVAKRKGSPCQQDDDCQDDKRIRSGADLPEDIFWYIHSLMPLRDAARAACVSHSFLRSWRCYPYLMFSEELLRLQESAFSDDERTRNLISKVNHILQNHSGIGVKKLELVFLDIILTVGFTRLSHEGLKNSPLLPINSNAEYSFPCSLLSDGNGNSIQYLHLSRCAILPTADLGCLRTLTTLHLYSVRITGFELECLLSNSPALEWLIMADCKEIVQLKIPSLLKRLHTLFVSRCQMLKVVESYAPNIATFHFWGHVHAVRMLGLLQSSILCYALTNLLSNAPNVQKLGISSQTQIVSTQTVPGKYLRLKHLHKSLNRSPNFDYLSLVSFLDASPSLETFILHIWDIYIPLGHMGHPWTLGDSEQLRQMPGHRHDSLKKFEVVGSCYAKSLVELTCHILETTSSLDRIKLDTCGYVGLCASGSGRCYPHYTEQIMEACNSVLAIRTYIMGKVPPTVKFELVEPCSRCPVQ
uniref:At1g61320/AtMIF1 LRR domain-containing protein n=1 Tax=Oryza meridionalis TaxID=40149 RepID=A0A0E0E8N5_9ORYZ